MRRVTLALLPAVLLAGCSSAAATTPGSRPSTVGPAAPATSPASPAARAVTAPACPAQPPRVGDRVPRDAARVVPRDLTAAVWCSYAPSWQDGMVLVATTPVRAPGPLAATVDAGPHDGIEAAACWPDARRQVLLGRTADGSSVTVDTACGRAASSLSVGTAEQASRLGRAFLGDRTALLGRPTADAVPLTVAVAWSARGSRTLVLRYCGAIGTPQVVESATGVLVVGWTASGMDCLGSNHSVTLRAPLDRRGVVNGITMEPLAPRW